MYVREVLVSADVNLNLGGNTDNMFALSQGNAWLRALFNLREFLI